MFNWKAKIALALVGLVMTLLLVMKGMPILLGAVLGSTGTAIYMSKKGKSHA